MDIFNTMPISAVKQDLPKKGEKHQLLKRRLTPEQIRDKVQQHKMKNSSSSDDSSKISISQEAKELNKKTDHILESDIRENNPSNPATTERLKELVKSGGFHFSKKERAVLGEILKK